MITNLMFQIANEFFVDGVPYNKAFKCVPALWASTGHFAACGDLCFHFITAQMPYSTKSRLMQRYTCHERKIDSC